MRAIVHAGWKVWTGAALVIVAAAAAGASTLLPPSPASVPRLTALSQVQNGSGPGSISGTVTFSQLATGGPTIVIVALSGVPPGIHGFHVHEFGALGNSCGAAGAHFNPYLSQHGFPNASLRHVGDLGNVLAGPDGRVAVTIVDSGPLAISLSGVNSVVGRAVMLHQDPDDGGLGGKNDSLTTGHAGPRIACAIIYAGASA